VSARNGEKGDLVIQFSFRSFSTRQSRITQKYFEWTKYEAPELSFIEADDVVMGAGSGGFDGSVMLGAPDFEFEQD
jgi:hypothetical protein